MAVVCGKPISCKHPLRDVTSCCLPRDKQTLMATGLQNGYINLWELTTGQSLMTLEGAHKGPVTGITFNQDCTLLASCGEDCNLILWDLSRIDNKQVKHRFLPGHGPNTPLLSCSFSPDSLLLCSCGKDGDVILWGQLGRPVAGRLTGHTNWVTCSAWSPNNKFLVTGSYDHSVILWEMNSFHSVRTIRHHQVPVGCVSMSVEGTVIASGDHDGVVFLTHIDGTVLRELRGHRDAVSGIAFAEVHGLVISASHDWSVKFWSLRGHCVRSIGVHRGKALSMALNEGQDTVITTGDDFTATILPFVWKEQGIDDDDDEEETDRMRDPEMGVNMQFEKNSQSDRATKISDRQSAVMAGGGAEKHSDRKSAISATSGANRDNKSHVSRGSKN
jgi:WD40 repeat protein